jgi:membrane protein implicated in regulation of membrane protease activity
MKLFWVILKGFLLIWVMLMAAVTGMLLLVLLPEQALIVGGLVSTPIAGLVTWLLVQSRVKMVLKAHPEFKKPRRP